MLSTDEKYRRYPGWPDVEALMKSASYWPKDSATLKQALAREQAQTGALAAAEEWERATGWTPFLVPEDTPHTTREFDFDNTPVTLFDGGALDISAVTVDGVPMPATLWRSLPRNAPSNRRPFEALAWTQRTSQRWQARGAFWTPPVIKVTARWGYCTVCPADAWQQILQAAGLVTLTQIENFQSIASLSQGGFSKAYDVVGILTQKDTADRWRKEFPASIKRYERQVC